MVEFVDSLIESDIEPLSGEELSRNYRIHNWVRSWIDEPGVFKSRGYIVYYNRISPNNSPVDVFTFSIESMIDYPLAPDPERPYLIALLRRGYGFGGDSLLTFEISQDERDLFRESDDSGKVNLTQLARQKLADEEISLTEDEMLEREGVYIRMLQRFLAFGYPCHNSDERDGNSHLQLHTSESGEKELILQLPIPARFDEYDKWHEAVIGDRMEYGDNAEMFEVVREAILKISKRSNSKDPEYYLSLLESFQQNNFMATYFYPRRENPKHEYKNADEVEPKIASINRRLKKFGIKVRAFAGLGFKVVSIKETLSEAQENTIRDELMSMWASELLEFMATNKAKELFNIANTGKHNDLTYSLIQMNSSQRQFARYCFPVLGSYVHYPLLIEKDGEMVLTFVSPSGFKIMSSFMDMDSNWILDFEAAGLDRSNYSTRRMHLIRRLMLTGFFDPNSEIIKLLSFHMRHNYQSI